MDNLTLFLLILWIALWAIFMTTIVIWPRFYISIVVFCVILIVLFAPNSVQRAVLWLLGYRDGI